MYVLYDLTTGLHPPRHCSKPHQAQDTRVFAPPERKPFSGVPHMVHAPKTENHENRQPEAKIPGPMDP
jgi:hypothetical protein